MMLWGLAGLVSIAVVHLIMIGFPDLSDFGRMDPETRSWNANWNYHSEMSILRVVDRSVAMLEGPWRKSFEKCVKSCDFRDF